jgi:hypothetical protein
MIEEVQKSENPNKIFNNMAVLLDGCKPLSS